MRRNVAKCIHLVCLVLLLLCNANSARARTFFNGGANHRAHSKPGGPYYLVDWDGDGEEAVHFDASDSHSHYFNPGPPVQNGHIVNYLWKYTSSGKVLANTSEPHLTATFGLGKTYLVLEVTDNTGDKALGWTHVDVRRPLPEENKSPTVTSVSPESVPTYGGTTIKVRGRDFYRDPVIYFGDKKGTVVEVHSSEELTAECPAGTGKVSVVVNNGFGEGKSSASLEYRKSNLTEIEFEEAYVKGSDGDVFNIPEITSIRLGPDGLYYAGSLNGFIYTLDISRDLTVTAFCKSPSVGENRAVLGLGFHPNDIELPPKVYVSTSSLYWKSRKTGESWNNGKVEVWQKGANGAECLGHSYDIVRGLPVSNHDHGVNAIEFLSNGDMLVSVGGSTNAGVETNGDGAGGNPESPLSSAIVRVKLSKQSKYDGNIVYTDVDNPGIAEVESGDVEVYAPGFRNCFGMTLHSNGELYAIDNGANYGFGVASKTCTEVGSNVGIQDSLVHVKENNYYGHPNRNRGRKDPRQCSYKKGGKSDEDYTAELGIFDSSSNGILEYTANTFESQLRGNLFVSRMSWSGPGKVSRVLLGSDGDSIVETLDFHDDGGLVLVMSPYGDIIMPKIKQAKIMALRTSYESSEEVHLRSIWPRRGPPAGRNKIMLTGSGFTDDMQVKFGGKPCLSLTDLSEDGTRVWCEAPSGKPGQLVSVVAYVGSSSSREYIHGDYEYML